MSPLSVGLSASTKAKLANHSWVYINHHLVFGSCSGQNEERQVWEQSRSTTFTFQIYPLWNSFLMPSVNLQLCYLIDKATRAKRRSYRGNAVWRRSFLMWSLQSLLQDDQRPQNTHASAWWKEEPQLQPVRILKHQSWSSEKPHAGSQWREAFCLQTVQLLLHNSW